MKHFNRPCLPRKSNTASLAYDASNIKCVQCDTNAFIDENLYLFTEWEGLTGKYFARSQDVWTERREGFRLEREPNIFSSSLPTQSIVTFYHMTNLRNFSFMSNVYFKLSAGGSLSNSHPAKNIC